MEFDSTKHPISWFRDTYLGGKLTIKPPFQRKPVWVARQKCFLVESILMKLPIPEIYIQQTTTADGETTYAIVDGQQRIRTVLQFVGAETDPSEEEQNEFVLDKLPSNSNWANKSFKELTADERKNFYGYMFTVRYLETDNDGDIRDMFTRLNRYLTPLKPQELRNAIYAGPFVSLSNRLADNEYWAENRIITPASIRRMGDIEFVSELLIGVMHGPQGGSERVIDDYYAQYEDYEDAFPDQRRITDRFNRTLSTIQDVLPELKKTRWGNKTDFYTLFVAIASLLSTHKFLTSKMSLMTRTLTDFAGEVDKRLADEGARVSIDAIKYVRAVEKGANDKNRRGERHILTTKVISPFFAATRKSTT